MHTVSKQNTGRVCWSGFVLLELVSVAAAGCGEGEGWEAQHPIAKVLRAPQSSKAIFCPTWFLL